MNRLTFDTRVVYAPRQNEIALAHGRFRALVLPRLHALD